MSRYFFDQSLLGHTLCQLHVLILLRVLIGAKAGLFMSCFLRQDVVALRGTHSKVSTFYLKVNYHFYYLLTSWVYIAN